MSESPDSKVFKIKIIIAGAVLLAFATLLSCLGDMSFSPGLLQKIGVAIIFVGAVILCLGVK